MPDELAIVATILAPARDEGLDVGRRDPDRVAVSPDVRQIPALGHPVDRRG